MTKSASPSFFPDKLLASVAWSFSGEPFLSRTEFDAELTEYQADIMKNPSWNSSELALLAPEVVVQYDEWDEGDGQEGAEVTLRADDGKGFSTGELMFKVHNAFVRQLSDRDHHFFEGFLFSAAREGVPVYQVHLGS